MRPGSMTRARRRHRNIATESCSNNVLQLQGSARWSVTLSLMMRLFNKRVVRFESAKQLSRSSRDPKVNLHAYRKVRPVDQRAIVLCHDALHFVQFSVPAGCSFNQRHTRPGAGINISRHGGGDGKVDRYVTRPQSIREILRASVLVARRESDCDLVPLLVRQPGDELAHRAVSN